MTVEEQRCAPLEFANENEHRVRDHPVPMVRAHRMVTVEAVKFAPTEPADDRAHHRVDREEEDPEEAETQDLPEPDEAVAVHLVDRDVDRDQEAVREAVAVVEMEWSRWRNRWHLTG